MRSLIIALTFAALSFSSATARPVIGHASGDRVVYSKLGVSIDAPKGTTLLGPENTNEPVNYIWPWLKTPFGIIEIATAPNAKGKLFTDKLDAHLKSARLKDTFHVTEITPMEIDGLPIYRVALEGEAGFKVIRFYFLSGDRKLAFLHLHSWSDQDALESVAKSIQKTEQGAAANP